MVLHYYKLIGRNNYPLLFVLILNLVLGVLILFVCKRDIADSRHIKNTVTLWSHCDNIIDIQFMSAHSIYQFLLWSHLVSSLLSIQTGDRSEDGRAGKVEVEQVDTAITQLSPSQLVCQH